MPAETDTDQMDVVVRNRFHGFQTTKTIAEIFAVGTTAVASPITFTSGAQILTGTGDPTSVVQAPQGSIFLRTDGAAATTLYVKTGALIANWTAK